MEIRRVPGQFPGRCRAGVSEQRGREVPGWRGRAGRAGAAGGSRGSDVTPHPLTGGSMSSRRGAGPGSALPGWGGAASLRHLPLAAALGPSPASRRLPVGAGGAAAAGNGVPAPPACPGGRPQPPHRSRGTDRGSAASGSPGGGLPTGWLQSRGSMRRTGGIGPFERNRDAQAQQPGWKISGHRGPIGLSSLVRAVGLNHWCPQHPCQRGLDPWEPIAPRSLAGQVG